MSYYRKCAGIIVFNQDKKVLVCERIGSRRNQWQFPQGGIMRKEAAEKAAIRELKEETSITSVRAVQCLDEPLRYDFPNPVRRGLKKRGINSFGQDMYWTLLYFYGTNSEINVATKEPEFRAWEWVEPDEAAERIVHFKKEVYVKAVAYFKPFIDTYSCTDNGTAA